MHLAIQADFARAAIRLAATRYAVRSQLESILDLTEQAIAELRNATSPSHRYLLRAATALRVLAGCDLREAPDTLWPIVGTLDPFIYKVQVMSTEHADLSLAQGCGRGHLGEVSSGIEDLELAVTLYELNGRMDRAALAAVDLVLLRCKAKYPEDSLRATECMRRHLGHQMPPTVAGMFQVAMTSSDPREIREIRERLIIIAPPFPEIWQVR